jgi:hypothetical protein
MEGQASCLPNLGQPQGLPLPQHKWRDAIRNPYYLLVAQRYACLEHFAKQAHGQWLLTIETHLSGSLFIASINCHLPLAEVYEWGPFPSSD